MGECTSLLDPNRKLIVIAAVIIASLVVNALSIWDPRYQTIQFSQWSNIFQGTNYCVTAATSTMAVFVIGVQIYSSTRLNHQARRRYRHIIEIMIQSSVLYNLSVLTQAILNLINPEDGHTLDIFMFSNVVLYTSAIMIITTVCCSIFARPSLSHRLNTFRHLPQLSWLLV